MLNIKYLIFLVFYLKIFVYCKSEGEAEISEEWECLEGETCTTPSMEDDYKEDDDKKKERDDYSYINLEIDAKEDIRSVVGKLWKPKSEEKETQIEKQQETTTTVPTLSTESPEIPKPNEQERHDLEVTKQTNQILVNIERRFLEQTDKKETGDLESNTQESKLRDSNLQKRDVEESEDIPELDISSTFFQKDIILIREQAAELIQKARLDADKNKVCINGINTVINCEDKHISLANPESCETKKKT
uniref:Uncharacterized protein n=1 Tax=Strongyloides papillosus TaxID=174720 RepID=A0A0N5BGR2_STREA